MTAALLTMATGVVLAVVTELRHRAQLVRAAADLVAEFVFHRTTCDWVATA
jgi:hypothetical protein